MKTIQTLASFAAVSFTVFAAGCAVRASDSAESSSAAAISTSDKLEATWQQTGGSSVNYYAFTFNSDHSYSAQGGCPQGGSGPHCFAITGSQGTWSLGKSGPQLGAPGGADEIKTIDQFGQETDYFYKVTDTTLSLAPIFDGPSTTYSKGAAPAPTPPTANACESAGGSCVALAPGSCANGTVGDANTYSCGGGLGVECCLPGGGDDAGTGGADASPVQADAGADAAACQVATDCQGLLPGTCEVCSDGTTACAQWSCQAGQCVVTICN